jgi:nuclear factor related to kappa-B-binding protein
LLKTKRPAHVNLLGLVRDAAARLPGGVGTRPDVAILLKDSQYPTSLFVLIFFVFFFNRAKTDTFALASRWVVEEIPNGKLNTVVSGALDRLHSQNDPCVRFDPDQKLWIYLHRLRKEDDFGTRHSVLGSERASVCEREDAHSPA